LSPMTATTLSDAKMSTLSRSLRVDTSDSIEGARVVSAAVSFNHRGPMLSICYQNVVPKVRVELTQGHPYRFLSLVQVVLISVIRRDLVQLTEYFPASVRAYR